MGQFINKLKEIIEELSLARKISIVFVLGLSFVILLYVVRMGKSSDMEPLYVNMNSQDMGSIMVRLDKMGEHYQVDQERKTIMVPSSKVLLLRVKFAEEGLPRFGGIGFELFDENNFGMSEFEQRIRYQRALEGELSRTISSVKEVERARVHLVLPEKSVFSESQNSARASVIVKIGSGGALGKNRVQAITHLVASAVEGLLPDQVTVIDFDGRLLTPNSGDPSVSSSSKVFDQKLAIEKSYEDRIVSLLSPVVGAGKIVARASIEIDFTQIESVSNSVDPSKSAVLRESRSNAKTSEGNSSNAGTAGAAGNLPGGAGGTASSNGGGSSDTGTEEINYAVSRVTEKTTTPIGKVKKLSVAILVDGKYEEKDGEKVFIPRTEEELAKFEVLIKNGIGFSAERGDSIKVDHMQFQSASEMIEASDEWFAQKNQHSFLMKIIGHLVTVVIVLLILFFVVRPVLKTIRKDSETDGADPQLVGAAQNGDIVSLVKNNPAAAVNAIREWIK